MRDAEVVLHGTGRRLVILMRLVVDLRYFLKVSAGDLSAPLHAGLDGLADGALPLLAG
jgi:hypothetical protein